MKKMKNQLKREKITQFIEQDMFPHLGVSSTHEERQFY